MCNARCRCGRCEIMSTAARLQDKIEQIYFYLLIDRFFLKSPLSWWYWKQAVCRTHTHSSIQPQTLHVLWYIVHLSQLFYLLSEDKLHINTLTQSIYSIQTTNKMVLGLAKLISKSSVASLCCIPQQYPLNVLMCISTIKLCSKSTFVFLNCL